MKQARSHVVGSSPPVVRDVLESRMRPDALTRARNASLASLARWRTRNVTVERARFLGVSDFGGPA
jgi:hypothetical protein